MDNIVKAIMQVAILRADAAKMEAIVENTKISAGVRHQAYEICERSLVMASEIEDRFLKR